MPKPHAETLLEIALKRAEQQPDRRAFSYLEDGETREVGVSYAELDRRARAIAGHLQQSGLAGERVLLIYPPGLDFVTAFYACIYAGAIAVPAYPPDPTRIERTLPRVRAIIDDCDARAVVTTSNIKAMANFLFPDESQLPPLGWLASDEIEKDGAEDWREPPTGPDSIAFLQYTSGSTGSPKGVVITHSNLLVNQEMIRLAGDSHDESVIFSWVPFYHDLGLIGGVVHPVYVGATSILMSPTDFLQKPVRWLQAITRYRVTMSAGPNFGFDLCSRRVSDEDKESLDLSSWEMALIGAEPISASTLSRFAETFAPHGFKATSFFQGYGLAEAVLSVSSGKIGVLHQTIRINKKDLQANRVKLDEGAGAIEIVSCGRPLTDQEIVVVDPDSRQTLEELEIGEIWVSGGNIAAGYWNNPHDSEETFQACLAPDGRGPFLRTGDLGFFRGGELYVTGRSKDLIILRGHNHYPQDIEASMEAAHPLLRPGCGAAFSVELDGGEALVVLQEVRDSDLGGRDPNEVISAIRRTLLHEHLLRPQAVALLEPRSIPKTSSGKIQRSASKTAYLQGDLALVATHLQNSEDRPRALIGLEELLAHAPQDRANVLSTDIVTWLAQLLDLDPSTVSLELPLGEIGLDSLAVMEFTLAVDDQLGVALPMDQILEGASVREMAASVLALLPVTDADD